MKLAGISSLVFKEEATCQFFLRLVAGTWLFLSVLVRVSSSQRVAFGAASCLRCLESLTGGFPFFKNESAICDCFGGS